MARSSNPLANSLISLADPRNLKAYQQNPDDYLLRFGVTNSGGAESELSPSSGTRSGIF
jgi:hypothetical protein